MTQEVTPTTPHSEAPGGVADMTSKPAVDLDEAAFGGDVEAIKQHISAGSNLNVKNEFTSTPLIVAVTFGQNEAARALIEGGADLNLKNRDGSTALHVAAFLWRAEIVRLLVDAGADKNAKNNGGVTARQSVEGPFEDAKAVYDLVGAGLGPYGLKLDYERIKAERPKIAEMLQ